MCIACAAGKTNAADNDGALEKAILCAANEYVWHPHVAVLRAGKTNAA